jgi:penicillin amidase
MRWLKRGVITLLSLLVIAAAAAWFYVERANPVLDGRLDLPGLQAEVRVTRDVHGIPTIRAANDADAWFALGVVHVQDRLWQMETHRRIGAGRLAEAFGPAALDTDRFLRALGVRRAAQAQWERLPAASRAVLEAYSAGVNAALTGLRARPPEFVILGVVPEAWTPVDSLAWALMMAWDLGGNWRNELLRMRLAATLPRERIDQLLPPYPGETPPAMRDYPQLYRDLGLARGAVRQAWLDLPQQAPPSGIEGTGSNNWVLAGSRSTTGQPLLANDPHLGLSTPALWYFARLKTPTLDVGGATMPGLPSVVLGQNAHIAWGFTNTAPDVQDLYIEQVDPADPKLYRTPEGSAAFETVEERIRVKGGDEVLMTVRRTRHGPVISDAVGLDDVSNAGHVLALRWTALDPDSDPIAPSLGMMRADSVETFVAAAEAWVAPMQNMVVADAAGHIGMVAPGRVPLRRADNDLAGQAPAPGWDARYDWIGWVPAGETPREIDPARGWIATANHRITAPDYRHHLTYDWSLPYRYQRIEQLLAEREHHSLDKLGVMQADVKSLAALKLLPWLKQAQPAHALATAAQQQIAGWDGAMVADRAGPLIHWAWQRALAQRLFEDEVGEPMFARHFAGRTFQDALEGVLGRDDAWWCDDKRTPAAETCAQQVDAALAQALDELAARFGSEPARWRWDDAHRAVSEHRPFSKVAALAPWFEISVPVAGDTYTVNAMQVSLSGDNDRRYRSTHGPSLRALYDVAERANSRVMHSSGQSGLPWSPAYRNFAQPWAAGQAVPLWPAADAAAAGGTLLLQPRTPTR